jgi:hypothetical protein
MTDAGKQYLQNFINEHSHKDWFMLEVDFMAYDLMIKDFWQFMERACGAFRKMGFEIRRWTKSDSEDAREVYLFKKRGKPLPTDCMAGKVLFEA